VLPQSDRRAVERAFASYYKRLVGFVHRRVHDLRLAEEIVQEVFLALLVADELPGDPESLEAWLYVVADRRVIDAWRSNSVVEIPFEMESSLLLEEFPTGTTASAIVCSFARLSAAERLVVGHHLLAGWRFDEIAEAFGTTNGASRMLFRRGLRRLRVALSELGVGDEDNL
jgi:RNA polymerase sigma-70 factor (ECF subfamily)